MQKLEEIEIQRHSESDPTKIVPSGFSPSLHAAPALQLIPPPPQHSHNTPHDLELQVKALTRGAAAQPPNCRPESRRPVAQHSAAQRTLVAASLRFTPTAASATCKAGRNVPILFFRLGQEAQPPAPCTDQSFRSFLPALRDRTEQSSAELRAQRLLPMRKLRMKVLAGLDSGQRWSATLRDWACRSPAPAQRWRARAKNPSHPRPRDFVRNIGYCRSADRFRSVDEASPRDLGCWISSTLREKVRGGWPSSSSSSGNGEHHHHSSTRALHFASHIFVGASPQQHAPVLPTHD